MDDKEKDLTQNENNEIENDKKVEDNNEQKSTSYIPENVSYEENDSWNFEAEAPALSQSIVFDSNNSKIEISSHKDDNVQYEKNYNSNEKQVTVNTDIFKFTGIAVIVAVIFIVIGVLGFNYYTKPNSHEKLNPGNVAMTVGDEKISVGMYNFYYNMVYNNYANYASQGMIDLNSNTVDKDGNEITWAEKYKNDTVEQIKYVAAYYSKAVEKGFELTKDEKQTINESIKSLKDSASASSMSLDKYTQELYGEYCGAETYEKYLTQLTLAKKYYNEYLIETKATDEEIEEKLSKDDSAYEEVPYAYLQIAYDSEDKSSEKETVAKVEKALADVKDFKSFKALIPTLCSDLISQYLTYYGGTEEQAVAEIEAKIQSNMTKSNETWEPEIVEWLFSDDTAVNSTKYVVSESDSQIYAVIKLGQPKYNDEVLYSVRHILIQPESADEEESSTTTEKEYTQEEWDAAYEKTNEVLKEYMDGDKTELSFAKLSDEYSTDPGVAYGGLYDKVPKGEMVEEFENWSTDESRKYGDVEIVKSKFGYHIMFFVDCAPSYKYQVKEDILLEKENEFLDSYKTVKRAGYSKVNNKKPSAEVTTN